MPIPIKVRDNTSNIRVRPVDNTAEITITSSTDARIKALDGKINKEIDDRITADENLQAQIITKQDEILFINLTSESGILSEEALNSLKASRVNKIVYNKRIYSLGTRDEMIWTYVGSTNNPNLINTIIVNIETGNYEYVGINNRVLEEHIADNSRHITDAEREFWNNKVTADVTLENPEEQEYKLNLSKD